MPPDIKWTNFFYYRRRALTLECGIRRIIATFLCESDTSISGASIFLYNRMWRNEIRLRAKEG